MGCRARLMEASMPGCLEAMGTARNGEAVSLPVCVDLALQSLAAG